VLSYFRVFVIKEGGFFLKTTNNPTFKLFLICLIFAVVIAGPPSAAAEIKRVAVVPFKINAEKDLSFLRDGIVDMLTSRLSRKDKVAVLSRDETAKVLENVQAPLNESKARQIGTRLKVDYVLFGSLTVFGNSVSIDAKMIDVSGSEPPLTFFTQTQGMDPVISQINLFATDINAKIFGRAMPASKVYAQPQTPQEQTSVRSHPEKLIVGGFGEIDDPALQESAPGPGFMAVAGTSRHDVQFWKSHRLKHRITGMAIGDIDRDGKQEVVFITPHTVEAYRLINQRLHKVKTIADRGLDNLIGVDVADINANGYPEIIVSAINPQRSMTTSFVLEFDGQTYTELVTKSPWYFRVVEHSTRGQILLGQRQPSESPFSGNIHEMTWVNSGYEPANKVMRSNRANVLGLAYGNALNDGSEVLVAFDELDYLRIYGLAGKNIWKDGEYSGGTYNFIYTRYDGQGEEKDKGYYPMRVYLEDINRDGKNELITVKNQRFSKMLTFRKFIKGELEIRSWDGIGLTVLWKTRQLSGYISDFAVGDFDNDGKDELIAALVTQTGAAVTTTSRSSVIAYELQ
jgi:TolB-like protein